MRPLVRLKKWLEAKRQPKLHPINTDSSGFSMGESRLDWSQICSIAAFKRDMLTFDDVWFQLDGAGEPLVICEEQPGFAEWEMALCEHFPTVASWRQLITQPPFAENFTVLYRRT